MHKQQKNCTAQCTAVLPGQYTAREGKRQARKGIKAGKERCKGRQGKVQRQARKGTKAGQESHKSREEEKLQKLARKRIKAGKDTVGTKAGK